MRLVRVWTLPIFMAVITLGAFAQSNQGSVAGTVTDTSGAVVQNATVTAANTATGVNTSAQTSNTGYFRIDHLLPGSYSITVAAPGFKTGQRTGVEIAVGNTSAINVVLTAGAASQTVIVSGSALTLQSETSDVSTVLEPKAVADLPLSVGGSFLRTPVDFIFLTPGVTGGGPLGNNSIKFAGGQDLGGLILVDGLPLNTSTGNNFDSPTFTPSVDAIQEFNVILAGMPAEYGRTSGGIESFVTKSGTNQYHGEAYDYFRNDDLDANTWFNNYHKGQQCAGADNTPACRAQFATPSDKKNDYGVTFGGPVRIPKIYDGRDKTFVFFSFEQLRITNGGTALISVPTVANRNGDFSAQLGGPLLDANKNPILNPCTGQPVLQGQIFDPATTRTANGIPCRTPYGPATGTAPNVIPTNEFSKVAQNVLTFVPQPANDNASQNYFRVFKTPTMQTAETIRVDENFNDSNKMFASYSPNEQQTRCRFTVFPNYADPNCGPSDQFAHVVRVGYDHVFSPTFLNHFTFGGDRENHQVASPAAKSGENFNQMIGLGGTTGTTFPKFNYGQGYQGPGFGLDLALIDNHAYVFDSVDWMIGKHSLKIGGEFRYLQFSIPNRGGESGTFGFSTNETAGTNALQSQTGNSFASFLLGDVSSASVAYQLHAPRSSQFYYAAYIQDDYKATRTLTLNLGIRYDVEPAPREDDNDKSNFSPTLPDAGAGNLPGALYFAGRGPGRAGISSAFANTWYKDVAPRIGFSWAPAIWQGKAVLRGSYDIIYAALPISADIGTPAPGVNPVSPVSTGFNVNANYNDSATNFTAPFNLDAGFPAYSLQPNFDPSQANGTSNAAYIARSYGRPGMVQLYELEVQQQAPFGIIATIGGLGQHSTHSASNLRFINNLNPKYFALGTELSAAAGSPGAPIENPYSSFQSNFNGNGTVAQALRPFPQYQEIGEILENIGQSIYYGGFVRLQRGFKNGFSLLTSYTWSKILTDADSQFPGIGAGGNPIQNPFNLKQEKSYSTQDTPQSLTISYLYELPFGENKRFLNHGHLLNTAVSGWQVGGIQRYLSGQPTQFPCASPIPGTDTCTRYNLIGNVSAKHQGHYDPLAASDAIYNRAALQDPNSNVATRGYYTYGNMPRVLGGVRTPFFLDEAFSLIKRTPITEGTNLEFRADMFNAFNRHIFGGGDTNPQDAPVNGVGGFGTVGGVVNTQRQVQFMMQFNF